MRMRKKKNLIPRMERCAPCRVQDGFALKGRWREALMPSARELRLEVERTQGEIAAILEEKRRGLRGATLGEAAGWKKHHRNEGGQNR